MSRQFAVLTISPLLFASVAFGQPVYKWQDEKGQWRFTQGPSNRAAPSFRITVEKVEYRSGHIHVEGIAENLSNASLPSPKIKVVGLDSYDETIYGQGIAWAGESQEGGRGGT